MNNPWQILKQLEATDSKLEKQAIIEVEAKAGAKSRVDFSTTFASRTISE